MVMCQQSLAASSRAQHGDFLIVEMASSSGTGEPSAIPVPAPGSTEQEQKTPAARRNISRSEEDDSDDSGVIRDVARRLTVEAKSPESEVKKGMESAEAEVSLGSPRSRGKGSARVESLRPPDACSR